MRSFSIDGGGGALDVDMGATEREFPNGGATGVNFGVTEVGAPEDVPVPTTVIVPGTSIWKTPVKRFDGKSVSGNQRAGRRRYPPSLSMYASRTFSVGVVIRGDSGPSYSN
jgi:hypothetical protein